MHLDVMSFYAWSYISDGCLYWQKMGCSKGNCLPISPGSLDNLQSDSELQVPKREDPGCCQLPQTHTEEDHPGSLRLDS